MIWILFYYNSLPQFPEKCSLVSDEIVHRDYFMCNPTNTRHFQYPLFEKLAYDDGCHTREVQNFLKKSDPDKYVILYTRMTDIDGQSKNRIIGYLKVGGLYSNGNFGFTASEAVLLPRDECIDLAYTGRAVPVSWGNSAIKATVGAVLEDLTYRQKDDISRKYLTETKDVMNVINTNKLRTEMIALCENCESKNRCFWGKYSLEKKVRTLKSLYGKTSKTC